MNMNFTFRIVSIVLAVAFIIFGMLLKHKNKGKTKETVGWVCIGIGAVSIISNVLQILSQQQ